MVIRFLLLSALSFVVYGQSSDPFSQLPQSLKFLSGESLEDCFSPENQQASMSCSPSGEDKTNDTGERVIFKATALKDIPEEYRAYVPGEHLKEISPNNPIYFSFTHKNDNWMLLDGIDSRGLTGTVQFEVGGVKDVNGKKIAWGGYIYSALYSERRIPLKNKITGEQYTKPLGESWPAFAKTVDENEARVKEPEKRQITRNQENTVIAAFVSSKPQGKFMYWTVHGGLGIQDSDKGVVMHPLQIMWHQIPKMVKYDHEWDGEDRVYAGYLKGVVGLQKKLLDNQICTLNVDSTAGASLDTSGKRNFLLADVKVDLGVIHTQNGNKLLDVEVGGGAQKALGAGPLVASTNAGVGVNFQRVKVKTGFIVPLSDTYTEEFKTPYAHPQRMGYVKLVFVIGKIK